MGLPQGYEIDVLDRGIEVDGPRADELLAFWSEHGRLAPDVARERLPHVICLLRDGEGRLAGTSSAVNATIAEIGNRCFWLYRCLCPGRTAREAVEPMLIASREHLSGRVGVDGVRPLGICFPITDPELIAERDEAVWPESGMLFAGWTAAGEQLRICYFEGATIL